MTMRPVVLVLLFKVDLRHSETLRSLAAQTEKEFTLIAWDNSPEHASQEAIEWLQSAFPHAQYESHPENESLANVYTRVVRERSFHSEALFFFDQDSQLQTDYMARMLAAGAEHADCGLFLPIVRSHGHIVSPASLIWFKGTFWKTPRLGRLSSKHTVGINSGMMWRTSFLRDHFHGFPKSLRFYATDTWLCRTYAEHNDFLCVVDTEIQHGLSQFEVEPVDKKLWRHRDIVQSTLVVNQQSLIRHAACVCFVALQSIKAAVKYRDGRFLTCLK